MCGTLLRILNGRLISQFVRTSSRMGNGSVRQSQ